MNTVTTIIIGFTIGLIANFIHTEHDKYNSIGTILISVLSAFAGNFISIAIGFYSSNQPASAIGAILGSILMLSFLEYSQKTSNQKR